MSNSGGRRIRRDIAPAFAVSAAKRYANELRRYFNKRLGRSHDFEDLAQEVYLRLLRIDPGVRVQKPLAFIYGVARRVLADHRTDEADNQITELADGVLAGNRRDEVGDESTLSSVSEEANWFENPSEAFADRIEDQLFANQAISRAVAELSELQAAILVLRKRDGLSHEEIAAELGISADTVHKYLTKALAKVRMLRWDI